MRAELRWAKQGSAARHAMPVSLKLFTASRVQLVLPDLPQAGPSTAPSTMLTSVDRPWQSLLPLDMSSARRAVAAQLHAVLAVVEAREAGPAGAPGVAQLAGAQLAADGLGQPADAVATPAPAAARVMRCASTRATAHPIHATMWLAACTTDPVHSLICGHICKTQKASALRINTRGLYTKKPPACSQVGYMSTGRQASGSTGRTSCRCWANNQHWAGSRLRPRHLHRRRRLRACARAARHHHTALTQNSNAKQTCTAGCAAEPQKLQQ